jgi:hypothetical protein
MAKFDCEDLFYTRQFFSNTGIGHTNLTAEFSTPAMIWQVAIWPRREIDPHEFNMRDETTPDDNKNDGKRQSTLKLIGDDKIHDEHRRRLDAIMVGLNRLVPNLRERGCVVVADNEKPFPIGRPRDWDREEMPKLDPDDLDSDPLEPFEGLKGSATGFTLWWPDPADKMLCDRPGRKPLPTDLRVRVQADAGEHFSTITFIIDAGKPWNGDPVDNSVDARARGLFGERRAKIFKHIDDIRTISEGRLGPQGSPLVDLPPLPERIVSPPPDPSDTQQYNAWLAIERAAAFKLDEAARYLYADIWNDFQEAFGFNLSDITGHENEVFANFRGLMMSTEGITDPNAKLSAKPDAAASEAAMRMIPRFNDGRDDNGKHPDPVEPKAVVKAFQPFMRRFRPNADWRDWIACGIYDRRAIYISPLGSRSAYRDGDEGEIGDLIPAEHLPKRLSTDDFDPSSRPECEEYKGGMHKRKAPQSGTDRPAPFRYLVITKHAPNRRQAGRMIERINMTGVRRLYALKNWTVLQQANVWVRIYGQQLDEAYAQWIKATKKTRDHYKDECDARWEWQQRKLIPCGINPEREKDLEDAVAKLTDPEGRKAAAGALNLHGAPTQEKALEKLSALGNQYRDKRSWIFFHPDRSKWDEIQRNIEEIRKDVKSVIASLTDDTDRKDATNAMNLRFGYTQERAVAALWQLYENRNKRRWISRLLTLFRPDNAKWDDIKRIVDNLREAKQDRDIKLAEHNQDAEEELARITKALDRLGSAAVGGLSYRINRSKYFAELYRTQAEALKDDAIETWWSYSQFLKRGMEPTLQLIETIGDNHQRLQAQLQSIKQDILQSSINNQTESTRDNTYKLERIQTGIGTIAESTQGSEQRANNMQAFYFLVLAAIAIAKFVFNLDLPDLDKKEVEYIIFALLVLFPILRNL